MYSFEKQMSCATAQERIFSAGLATGREPARSLAPRLDGALVARPITGAFTPTCSAKHLPGFVSKADEIKAKGVDTIACLSVNDVFVMGAWGKDQGVGDKVLTLADGSAELTKAMGLELDLTHRAFGVRSDRYAMIVDDGVVTLLNREEPGNFDVSSAETVLAAL